MNTQRFANRIRLALSSVVLFTSFSQAALADVLLKGVQVSLPDGYERSESLGTTDESVVYVRKGDGKALIAKLLRETQFDSSFLEDWFQDDAVALLSIDVLDRPEEWKLLGADEVQREITRQLASKWGEFSFSLQSPDGSIRWFVNYAGAFVAISTRVLGDKIIVVESMDFVHVLVTEETKLPNHYESAERLWGFFRRAANADDAESVQRSARVPQPAE